MPLYAQPYNMSRTHIDLKVENKKALFSGRQIKHEANIKYHFNFLISILPFFFLLNDHIRINIMNLK